MADERAAGIHGAADERGPVSLPGDRQATLDRMPQVTTLRPASNRESSRTIASVDAAGIEAGCLSGPQTNRAESIFSFSPYYEIDVRRFKEDGRKFG